MGGRESSPGRWGQRSAFVREVLQGGAAGLSTRQLFTATALLLLDVATELIDVLRELGGWPPLFCRASTTSAVSRSTVGLLLLDDES